MNNTRRTQQRNISTYEFLWDGSQPSWCLLQRPERSRMGDALYWPFNTENPTQEIDERAFSLGIIDAMLIHHVPILSCEDHFADPLQDHCWKSGYSYPIIIGTYRYLLLQWEALVKSIVAGTVLTCSV